jgi:phosphoribosylformylglycinamidine synthase
MDFKQAGNAIYQIGATGEHLGGSHFALVNGVGGGRVPTVDGSRARQTFAAVHAAMRGGLIRACHDLSEGGLAVALAEMAFSGGCGAEVDLRGISINGGHAGDAETRHWVQLFSESNSRFLVEVASDHQAEFESAFSGIPLVQLGRVTDRQQLSITDGSHTVLSIPVDQLKQTWLAPLDWE